MEEYLQHHGILGQKWGVRRFQNSDGSLTAAGKKRYSRSELKDIHNERVEYARNARESDPRRKELDRIEKEAYDLASKYDFDQDDGGGGTTEADQAAGRKYWELWEDYGALEEAIEDSASKKATDHILEKYGETAIKQLKRANDAQAIAFVAAIWAVPAAVVIMAAKNSK